MKKQNPMEFVLPKVKGNLPPSMLPTSALKCKCGSPMDFPRKDDGGRVFGAFPTCTTQCRPPERPVVKKLLTAASLERLR
jgi:hypothetical protein